MLLYAKVITTMTTTTKTRRRRTRKKTVAQPPKPAIKVHKVEPTNLLQLGKLLWPNVQFYDKQREIIESVLRDDETYVPAGNMLGKDFVAGFIALAFFLMHRPCRVITTSVKDDHLRVLWGELKRFIYTMSRQPTKESRLVVNYREIRRFINGEEDPISYIHGTVSEKGEGLAGHHAAHTLLIVDEASGVDDTVYEYADTWAQHKLIIGNPNPCTNFFYRGVKEGDWAKPKRVNNQLIYYRKVIKICAEDSPNVKLGQMRARKGKEPDDEGVIPGVLGYQEYVRRRKVWPQIRQTIGLDGEFYEGRETMLYPEEWLQKAQLRAKQLEINKTPRKALSMGIDPGEGDANTAWTIGDTLGIIKLHSEPMGGIVEIADFTISLMLDYDLEPEQVFFDRGGGGKQIADHLRDKGYEVNTVAFGESVRQEMREGYVPIEDREDIVEQRYAYANRRAQMYGLLRLRLDPTINENSYGIPSSGKQYQELRRQLKAMPLRFDEEGRMLLPPKQRRSERQKGESLMSILGCSPDEADSLVLMNYGLQESTPMVLGPTF